MNKMNEEELKADIIKVDRETEGKINAEWWNGNHFYYLIFQLKETSKREYSEFYWDYDGDVEKVCDYESLEELIESIENTNGDWSRIKWKTL